VSRKSIGIVLLMGAAIGTYFYFRKKKAVENLPPPFEYKSGVPVAPTKTPRGIRNNNPGNIKISKQAWKGKVPREKNTDGTFEQFESMTMGVRALMRNLRTYINQGDNTTRKIVSKWAPKNENNVSSYLDYVTRSTGLSPDLRVTENDIKAIARAIIYFENGQSIPESIINSAALLI
jgi:hypothetical protein